MQRIASLVEVSCDKAGEFINPIEVELNLHAMYEIIPCFTGDRTHFCASIGLRHDPPFRLERLVAEILRIDWAVDHKRESLPFPMIPVGVDPSSGSISLY